MSYIVNKPGAPALPRGLKSKFKGNPNIWIYQFRKSGLKSLNLSPDYTFTDKRLQLWEKIAKLSTKGEWKCQNQMATKMLL